jgi:hypothetical protein
MATAAAEFRGNVLEQLVPFNTQEDLEELFCQMFDGAEVLPLGKLGEYRARLEDRLLEAGALTVPVSGGQLRRLRREGRLRWARECGLPANCPPVADAAYCAETGLELGLPTDFDHT